MNKVERKAGCEWQLMPAISKTVGQVQGVLYEGLQASLCLQSETVTNRKKTNARENNCETKFSLLRQWRKKQEGLVWTGWVSLLPSPVHHHGQNTIVTAHVKCWERQPESSHTHHRHLSRDPSSKLPRSTFHSPLRFYVRQWVKPSLPPEPFWASWL